MTDPAAIRTTIAPWLSVRNSARAVEFYKSAFGAAEVFRMESGDSVVARLSVEGAEFWVGEESPEHANFSPETLGGGSVRIILTVADPDAAFARAVAAGASQVHPVGLRLAFRPRRRSFRTSLGDRPSAHVTFLHFSIPLRTKGHVIQFGLRLLLCNPRVVALA